MAKLQSKLLLAELRVPVLLETHLSDDPIAIVTLLIKLIVSQYSLLEVLSNDALWHEADDHLLALEYLEGSSLV